MRHALVLDRLKVGERLPKVKMKLRTVTPDGWNPTDINAFAKASEAWRRGYQPQGK